MRKISGSLMVLIWLILNPMGLDPAYAVSNPGEDTQQGEHSAVLFHHIKGQDYSQKKHVPGEMIIKFRDDAAVGEVAAELFERKGQFETVTRSPNLDKLNKKFRIKSMKRVFGKLLGGKKFSGTVSQRRAYYLQKRAKARFFDKIEYIKKRFPKRAKRIPKDVKVPYLNLIYRVEFEDKDVNVEAAATEYAKDPNIEYAEPNSLDRTYYVPNDPRYIEQWAHQNTHAEPGWDMERGDPNITIAIVDTGIDYNHEDLRDNIWYDEQGKPGKDFVDIVTEQYTAAGYQLVPGEDYTVVDDDTSDYNGHGTHCAGIAGAVGGNGIGVAGVCHNCKNDYAFSSEKVIVVVSTQAVRSRSNICDSQNRRLKR